MGDHLGRRVFVAFVLGLLILGVFAMRLTLRTLLAYLDDLLEPIVTRELGQKINDSPVAQTLITRIREVMRRRRLSAYAPDGDDGGIDPNDVAEYLDSQLPTMRTSAVEEQLLASDQALAEVAATHQILALALSEPVEIPHRLRDRMYDLGTSNLRTEVSGGGASTGPASSIGAAESGRQNLQPAIAPSSKSVKPSVTSFQETLPDYLKTSPSTSSWLLPMMGLVAMVIVGVMAWSDIARFFGERTTEKSVKVGPPAVLQPKADADVPDPVVASVPDVLVNNDTPEKKTEDRPDKKTELVASLLPSATAAGAGFMENLKPDPAPPADPKPALGPAPMPEPKPAPDAAVAMAPVNSLPKPDVPKMADTTPAQATSSDSNSNATSSTPEFLTTWGNGWRLSNGPIDGMLVRWRSAEGQWKLTKPESTLLAGDILAVPGPIEAVVDVQPDVAKIAVLANTRIQLAGSQPDLPVVMGIEMGRLVLQPKQPAGMTLGLTTPFGSMGRLVLPNETSICAVETLIDPPVGLNRRPEQPRLMVLYVVSGTAKWQTGTSAEQELMAGKSYVVRPTETQPAGGAVELGGSELPNWLDNQQRRPTSIVRRHAQLFEQEFAPDQPVDVVAWALSKDTRPKIAEFAAHTLVVTGAWSGLAETLARSPHEEARAVAAMGLKEWLSISPAAASQLKGDLGTLYSDAESAVVFRLLWGFLPAEARETVSSQFLVDALQSSLVEVREMAFSQLVQLTNRKYDFRPLGTAAQRGAAVNRWQQHLDQRGGVLVKE